MCETNWDGEKETNCLCEWKIIHSYIFSSFHMFIHKHTKKLSKLGVIWKEKKNCLLNSKMLLIKTGLVVIEELDNMNEVLGGSWLMPLYNQKTLLNSKPIS